jgi:hypothetical protein
MTYSQHSTLSWMISILHWTSWSSRLILRESITRGSSCDFHDWWGQRLSDGLLLRPHRALATPSSVAEWAPRKLTSVRQGRR